MTRWLVLLGLFAGCSFSLSGPDPNRPHGKAPDCSLGKTSVVLDGLLAGVSGLIAISLASSSSSGAAAVAPLAVGALFTGAAIHGNSVVNDCRRANEEYLAEVGPGPAPIANAARSAEPLRPPSGPVKATPAAEADAEPEPEQEPAEPAAAPPQAQQPQAQQPQAQQPPPPPAPDSWSSFWKEVR